ncbi:hydroxyacid dehydrogenase [Sedimentibacter sp. B4]|uniref:hydroxyacid dehydrogenase n=1 Tax=Sedimentibacter sp. B4 TaxID=304766 RepID=UPI0002EA4742|nr:hydroxyacid dehydrogenase [Sedimentibacter sp. B4]
MTYKVLLPQPIMKEGRDYLLSKGYEIVDGRGMSEQDIINDIYDCDAIIVRTPKITEKIINAAPKLKIIARHGAGYDGVDLESARQHNVLVVYAPGANSVSVAELVIFYMLYCSRNFKMVQKTYIDDYFYAKLKTKKNELYGKTLGLIGIGNIGSLVAEKASLGLGMNVIAFDPFAKRENLPDYIKLLDDRDKIFTDSDYVSLHVPATKDTINSVSTREFELMKETSFLINTARGTIVDEDALYKALINKQIAGAALDVMKEEPVNKDNPLLALDNVLTAPHIGAATEEASSRSSLFCAMGIDDYLNGRVPKYIVPELRDMINNN